MRRVGLTGGHIGHQFDVAVIRGDQTLSAGARQRCGNALESAIDGFYCADGRGKISGVTHHVAVGVIADDEIETLLLDGLDQPIRHFGRAHFRLQIVGRHFG